MAIFHLMHYVPDPKLHGLHGYREIIETVAWGLEQLGHQVSVRLNGFDPAATNILFGAHMLSLDAVRKLPKHSISYNLEQVRHLDPKHFTPGQRLCLERFEIWEYSAANLATWRGLSNTRMKHVPIGYAPVLTRIPKAVNQDIDVLIYGMSGPKRLAAFHQLSLAGMTTLFVSGLYGEARDQLISRSKIVLNVNLHEQSQIFEIARVSYLLANRKAVVALKDPLTFVEDDVGAGVRFTTLEGLAADCRRILDDEAARVSLENSGFEIIARRDIRHILQGALSARE